jgi:hypothetical protein
MRTGVLSRGESGRDEKITTDHLVPRLRMSGATPPLRLYTFMAWTGKTSLSLLLLIYVMWTKFKGVKSGDIPIATTRF